MTLTSTSLPASIATRLRLPLIAAPMLRISGPDLVAAACTNGVIGAFPTANARNAEELDAWLGRIRRSVDQAQGAYAPWCPNLIMRRDPQALSQDIQCLTRHGTEMVITSVGSPKAIVAPLHDAGCLVLADVASVRHAERALEAGVDGLVLLTAGAGGQTGWANSFVFVRTVRRFYSGPLVLAGGGVDGAAVWAARALGCDLSYMGTKFIATHESMASDGYRRMLAECGMDDVQLTRAFTGLEANMLRPSIVANGLDPLQLDENITPARAREIFGQRSFDGNALQRWKDLWSAGHSVAGVDGCLSVAQLVEQTHREYLEAAKATAGLLEGC